MHFRLGTNRGSILCEMGCTFHRPTMAFGMRWHGTRHGVAWRGVACHPIPWRSQSKIQDRPKTKPFITETDTFLTSPQLVSFWPRPFQSTGFPWGFPIASPSLPPISGKSHKHPSLPRPPPPLIFSLRQLAQLNLVSSRNTFLMGLSPRSAKLQVTSLPHFPSPRSPSCLRLSSLCDQTPLTLVHPDPPQ